MCVKRYGGRVRTWVDDGPLLEDVDGGGQHGGRQALHARQQLGAHARSHMNIEPLVLLELLQRHRCRWRPVPTAHTPSTKYRQSI
jgi:hypothetical protein